MAITAFLFRSPGLLNRGPGGPASLGHGPHSSIFFPTGLNSNRLNQVSWGPPLLGAGSLYSILSPTNLNFLSPGLYNNLTSILLPASVTQFNPSTVKVISWYSSSGWTCYLHRCISYFDSSAGVNMQHRAKQCIACQRTICTNISNHYEDLSLQLGLLRSHASN